MSGTARRAATATLVALSIVVGALALWKIKAVIALLFLGFTLAAAMRPGVEWLHRRLRIAPWILLVFQLLALLDAAAQITLALNSDRDSLLRHFATRDRVDLITSTIGAVLLIPAI